jgi:hypothetical protein
MVEDLWGGEWVGCWGVGVLGFWEVSVTFWRRGKRGKKGKNVKKEQKIFVRNFGNKLKY